MPPTHVILYLSPYSEEFCACVCLMNPYWFSKTQFKCHVPQEVCPGTVSPSFYCSQSPRSSRFVNTCIVTGLLMTYHHLCMLSRIRFFSIPWTVARQSSPSMEFSGQEYWTGLPFPSLGGLPYPGLEPGSLALAMDSSLFEPRRKSPLNLLFYFESID